MNLFPVALFMQGRHGHTKHFLERLHEGTLKMDFTFLTKSSWRYQHSKLWNHCMCCPQSWNLVHMQAKYCRSVNDQLSTMPCFAFWLDQCLRQQGTSVRQTRGLSCSSWATSSFLRVQGVAPQYSETFCSTHDYNVTTGMQVKSTDEQFDLHETQLLLYFLRKLCCNEMSWLCHEACQYTVLFVFLHSLCCCIGSFAQNYNCVRRLIT